MEQLNDLSRVFSQDSSGADALSEGFDMDVKHGKSFARYVGYAIQALREHNLVLPDVDRVILIVQSALAAQSLFFAASLHHPEQVELHQVFESFVLNCVMPSKERSFLWASPSND